MVVKSKLGRKRYIIIKIDSHSKISKYDLIFTLNRLLSNNASDKRPSFHCGMNDNGQNGVDPEILTLTADKKVFQFYQMPWVINIVKNFGIIRCHHLDKEKTIELLQSIKYAGKFKNSVKITTLGTTGTILSARKKYLDKLTLYP